MKIKAATFLPLLFIALMACQPAVDPLQVNQEVLLNDQQKQSYALGANMGHIVQTKMLSQQKHGVEYQKHLVVQGFVAAMQGQSQLDKAQIQNITRQIEQQIREKQALNKEQIGQQNLMAGQTFLEQNANRKGITVTPSGLQYEVLKQGQGAKPKATDTVKVHYRGTLLDGTEFDSSYTRGSPLTFPLNRVIKGWTEGLQLMQVGAKYKFYIPSELAYGSRNTSTIPSHSSLIFEVNLIEIIDTEKTAQTQ
ncbi:FKBP-type peptidyl-prolyl cis-trans isomerase [Paraglaciecola aestuariivivens]